MRNTHESNLAKIDHMIAKSKNLLKLDFFGYQSIAKLQHTLEVGKTLLISGNYCTPTENVIDDHVRWNCKSPEGCEYDSHFHAWSETITMTLGMGLIQIFDGDTIIERIVLETGESYTIEPKIVHTFKNIDDREIKYSVLHKRE